MAKSKKPRKKRKTSGTRRKADIYDYGFIDDNENLHDKVGGLILDSFNKKDDIEIIETPFGKLRLSDGALANAMNDKGLFLEVAFLSKDVPEDKDPLDTLVRLEKLSEKFPDEPFLHYKIAECYLNLKKKEKFREAILKNYEAFSDYPLIDIEYAHLMLENKAYEKGLAVFNGNFNISEVYSKREVFVFNEVEDFYMTMGNLSLKVKDFDNAQKCLEVLDAINSSKANIFSSFLEITQNPWLKKKLKIQLGAIILVIIAIIVGIIWGIVKFFQWVF